VRAEKEPGAWARGAHWVEIWNHKFWDLGGIRTSGEDGQDDEGQDDGGGEEGESGAWAQGTHWWRFGTVKLGRGTWIEVEGRLT